MVRRLLETLIIEAYEHLGRPEDIRDSNGYYLMLGDLVGVALGQKGLNLGRKPRLHYRTLRNWGTGLLTTADLMPSRPTWI